MAANQAFTYTATNSNLRRLLRCQLRRGDGVSFSVKQTARCDFVLSHGVEELLLEVRVKGVFWVLFVLGLFLTTNVALAVDRYAIVIGNSDYESAPLNNPRNDALDMADELVKLGYQLHRGKALLDLELGEFENELREFAFNLPRSAVAVVYFAGHGVATDADNYLIPKGANLVYQEQLKTRAVSLRDTVALLSERNRDGLNVFFLDACRDSPLDKQYVRGGQNGLNRIGDLAKGSFIGYAADKGQVAIDGLGRNGVYTGELLTALRNEPGMPIQLLHNRVAQRVYEKTSGTQYPQLPVSEQKFIGEYCIGACENELLGKKLNLGSQPKLPPSSGTSSETIGRTEAPVEEKTFNKKYAYFAIAGAVILGVLAASASGGDGDGNEATPSDRFTLNIPALP